MAAWSKQSVTSTVSAAAFVLLAVLVAFSPVPYVAWSPGRTVDLATKASDGKPVVEVTGLNTTPLTGQLRMTTVSVTTVDSQLSLPEALLSYWLPHRDVLPRELVYPSTKSVDQVKAEEVAMMDTSQRDAVVAALRAAAQPVKELPMVSAVSLSDPTAAKLKPGDLVLRVDGKDVQSTEDISRIIKSHAIGDVVVFGLSRDGQPVNVEVTLVANPKVAGQPQVGASFGIGYDVGNVRVKYHVDPAIVGPSAGLMFSLAIYSQIAGQGVDVLGGRVIAGTGTISPEGTVGSIGGIQEKVAGAQKSGATIFLVPAANCTDLAGVKTSMTLVKVADLRGAISALKKLKQDPNSQEVPRC